jgi:hypothetical protein
MPIARLLGFLLAAPVFAVAADFPAADQAQVEAVLGFLGRSTCQFYRNGQWYDGLTAEHHLRGKFDYLVKKGWIHNTEEFLDNAATKSSFTGEPYRVRCPGGQAQSSAEWLRSRIAEMRVAKQDKTP